MGRFTQTGSGLVWCASSLAVRRGDVGTPDEAVTRATLQLFDRCLQVTFGRFALVLDSRGVDAVDPHGLGVLVSWLVQNRAMLAERITLQASIIQQGPVGFLLAGLLPSVAYGHPARVFHETSDAFEAVCGEEGAALGARVDAIAARIRGCRRELHVVRALLAADVDATIDRAAKAVGVSTRSLQRILGKHGVSFHEEVTERAPSPRPGDARARRREARDDRGAHGNLGARASPRFFARRRSSRRRSGARRRANDARVIQA